MPAHPRTSLGRAPGRLELVVVMLAYGLIAACAALPRIAAVPSAMTVQAQAAVPNARFFPDRNDPAFATEMQLSQRKEMAWLAASGHTGPLPPAAFLTVSGGSGDGAFGAGLLAGWSEAGTRPSFKLVTGISTGALIAPFAFVGPKYDRVMKEAYTTGAGLELLKRRGFITALFSDAMADNAPMARLIDKYVTRELLDDVAAEYAKGRILLVGTTNLDCREPVYWNMGAIATSRDLVALKLFRKVILASAAIPGVFPPVMIDVTVGETRYQEMHVDGGTMQQVFMYPHSVHLAETTAMTGADRQRAVYIIRNARIDPDWASVDRRLMDIVGRSVSSLIQTQGLGDLNRMYLTATRDHVDYNLAYIPRDFTATRKSEFDVTYMRPLFERGRQLGVGGFRWEKYPPGFDPDDVSSGP